MCFLFFKEALVPKLLVFIIHMISFHQHLLSLSLCLMSGCLHYSLLLFCFLSPGCVQSVPFSLLWTLSYACGYFLSLGYNNWMVMSAVSLLHPLPRCILFNIKIMRKAIIFLWNRVLYFSYHPQTQFYLIFSLSLSFSSLSFFSPHYFHA